MPSWWKVKNIGSWHRTCIKPPAHQRRHSDTASEKGSQSDDARSPSPSKGGLCGQNGGKSRAKPLPLPADNLIELCHCDSGNMASPKPLPGRGSKPCPKTGHAENVACALHGEENKATNSNSSKSCNDAGNAFHSLSHPVSPKASDYESGIKSDTSSSYGVKYKGESPISIKKNSREVLTLAETLLKHQNTPTSQRRRPLDFHGAKLQIPPRDAFLSAPDTSMPSPRSPMWVFGPEPLPTTSLSPEKAYTDSSVLGSGQCRSPSFGRDSSHNSITGDVPCQSRLAHNRCSPECSPLRSPRVMSKGPNLRMHDGAVSPPHPHAGGPLAESPTARCDDGRQQGYKLPLPPMKISNRSPFSPYSAGTSPKTPYSPYRICNPLSPGSRWKKGRLIGRGTYGHVYQSFDSASGEMCAMKEVVLLAEDAKSRECVQQLAQEIALLSRLCHPNIVQYYGSEIVGDKLCVYLEFVSGGSVYKLLQEYGPLGDAAIRSYTRQILCGLAYLHAQNTLHRDIKGANILVDPNGPVKLADFGMAKHLAGESGPLSFKGSPYWMAPEVIKNSKNCSLAVDVWSLGCTVLEMATAKPPWSEYEGAAAMFKVANGKELPEIPDLLSDEGKDFVGQCLQHNPSDRPTAAQLLEHPFVKNIGSPGGSPRSSEFMRVSELTHDLRVL